MNIFSTQQRHQHFVLTSRKFKIVTLCNKQFLNAILRTRYKHEFTFSWIVHICDNREHNAHVRHTHSICRQDGRVCRDSWILRVDPVLVPPDRRLRTSHTCPLTILHVPADRKSFGRPVRGPRPLHRGRLRIQQRRTPVGSSPPRRFAGFRMN